MLAAAHGLDQERRTRAWQVVRYSLVRYSLQAALAAEKRKVAREHAELVQERHAAKATIGLLRQVRHLWFSLDRFRVEGLAPRSPAAGVRVFNVYFLIRVFTFKKFKKSYE